MLAWERAGREGGPRGAVEVVEADPDVEPTADGAQAYRIEADGTTVGTVAVTPESARLRLERATAARADRDDVTVEADGAVVVAHAGAAVKMLVDVVADDLH